jgi:hypothetical protein
LLATYNKGQKPNVTAELAQAAENSDHQLYVVSKILDARYNEQDVLRVVGRVERFPRWRGHLRTLLSYSCGYFGHGNQVHRVSQGYRRGAHDAISL